MKISNTYMQKLLVAAFGLSAIMLPTAATSAPGNLASQPIFTQNAVDPNILLSIDDSGSMDWETLFPTDGGILRWSTGNASFYDGTGAPINAGRPYYYLFPNGTGFGNGRKVYPTATFGVGAIPPFKQFGFSRSADYNSAYFDPTVTYAPWSDYDQQTFNSLADIIDPTDTPADPLTARSLDRFDLTTNRRENAFEEGFVVDQNMIVPQGTVFWNGAAWVTAGADGTFGAGAFQVGIEYYPATYYKVTATGTYTVLDGGGTVFNGDCTTPTVNQAAGHYPFFETRPSTFAGSSSAVDGIGPDGRCLEEVRIAPGSTEMQNFANWFSYYRKRHLALRAGLGLSFNNINGARVDSYTINTLNAVNMLDLDVPADKNTVLSDFYNFPISAQGTPNRRALNFAGQQYERTGAGAPITEECQKNFTIFFTDGFTGDTNFTGIGNADGNDGQPYADTRSNTLGDIAMKYYEDNLDNSYPSGQVPVDDQCDIIPLDPQLDCNTNLHMVTYSIGLGAAGNFFNNTALSPGYTTVADAYATPFTWPNVNVGQDQTQIDDLYHAAVNGRGEILNAATPAELTDKLGEALVSITKQTGSAASVAFNTSVLSAGSVVYLARFRTNKWQGELLSFGLDVNNNGDIAIIENWDAGNEIPNADERVIYSYNPDIAVGAGKSKGVLFQAGTSTDLSDTELPTIALNDLTANLPTVASGLAAELTEKDLLNYLRGDRTFEGPDDNGIARFRVRSEDITIPNVPSSSSFISDPPILGDIVHSGPLFVGDPVLNWPTGNGTAGSFPASPNDYSTWKDSINRTPVIYVGANDGMLHGFDATNGEELMAYIPSSVYSNNNSEGLHYLAEPGYQHGYYVDNTASRTDAYIRGRNSDGSRSSRDWRSVLVGTLRGGGKGVFALDVTDPERFANNDAGNAAEIALWEFTSNDDADLGFTFSRPTIVPTNATEGGSGPIRWAAIFGNGYNDGGDCRAKLFVLFLDGGLDGTWTAGTDYLELDTEVGSVADCNGLSNVSIVDFNGDGKADGAYGGDLHGNMWAFDLCNEDNQGNCQGTGWDISYRGNGNPGTPLPLFTATDPNGNRQQITAPPTIITHPTVLTGPSPNVLVLFGTGQYIVDSDKDASAATTQTHSYYGVWDRGDDSLDRTNLLEQLYQAGFGQGADFRKTEDEPVDYTTPNNFQYGWYIELPDTSEADDSPTGAPERVTTSSAVVGNIVFFNSFVPTVNGCDVGGYSHITSVKAENGGTPPESIFDVNLDGTIDDGDFVGGSSVSSKKVDGIVSPPEFLGDIRYESTSKGKIIKDSVKPGDLPPTGRFSWNEIRPQDAPN